MFLAKYDGTNAKIGAYYPSYSPEYKEKPAAVAISVSRTLTHAAHDSTSTGASHQLTLRTRLCR